MENREDYIKEILGELIGVIKDLDTTVPLIIEASHLMIEALENGKKIIIAGNGGSAADAQHLAAEFVGRFRTDRKPLSAIALTTDTSILTAISNDYCFSEVFSRQMEAIGNEGDVFLAISTGGESSNILQAINVAFKKKIKVIGLTGGNHNSQLCNISLDLCITTPSLDTARIQEAHLFIEHLIIDLVEKNFA